MIFVLTKYSTSLQLVIWTKKLSYFYVGHKYYLPFYSLNSFLTNESCVLLLLILIGTNFVKQDKHSYKKPLQMDLNIFDKIF